MVSPSIILIEPQLGQNIGMSARAMLNCGLCDLRLVRPRDGWPNRDAIAAATEAVHILENAKIFHSTNSAISDLSVVFATSARTRDMNKPFIEPKDAMSQFYDNINHNQNVGVMFGCESKGLKNDDVTLTDALISIPANPYFNSLNLAQAVYAIGYEWFQVVTGHGAKTITPRKKNSPARKKSLIRLFEHLELELEKSGFLRVTEKQASMKRNLRNMLTKAKFTEQEVRTFRGIVRSLTSFKNKSE